MKNCHGVTFTFPPLSNRTIARAGWIVAIGLSDAKALPDFATSFGDFKRLFTFGHHRGPGQGSRTYWRACQYLPEFISGQLEKAFPNDECIRVAKRAIERLLKEHTGSGISIYLDNTPLENAMCEGMYTNGLNASEIEFAIFVFNSLEIERPNIDRLQGIILPVLAGAIRGVYKVLQHLNTRSFQLRGDFNDLVDQNLPVFLS
jgi:hypothetical protein